VAVAGVAIGVSTTTATVSPTVQAYVGAADTTDGDGDQAGTPITINAASLIIQASQAQDSAADPTAYAYAVAGAGGALEGVQATLATASDAGTVQAYTGDSVTLPNGDVAIIATNQTGQSAYATAGAAGLVAAGGSNATADSAVTTSANLGTNTRTNSNRTGALVVLAKGSDSNTATGVAGSGGFFAGAAALGISNDTSTVTAGIGGGTSSSPATLYAGNVVLSAINTDTYAPGADSTLAAAVGGSGAHATAENTDSLGNTKSTSTTAAIGDNTKIMAFGTVTVEAQNQFLETRGGATGGAGGVINGSAASSDATLHGNASVTLGNSVSIVSGTDPVAQPGGIVLVASSTLHTNDLVTLASGGAIEGADTDSKLDATLTNTVTLGSNDTLASAGNIGVGTYTTANAQTNSEVNTYGLASVGTAEATTKVTTNQSVTVGTGTKLTAFGNVNLTPGNEPNGLFNTVLSGLANAQSYFYGLFDTPQATANTDLVSNATLTINTGAVIQSEQEQPRLLDHVERRHGRHHHRRHLPRTQHRHPQRP
jgi:hypothetical protein